MRKVNKAGLDLVKSFEGLELKAYQDSVGVWTIGYGHTEGVKRGDVITREEANRIFEEDINKFAVGVEKVIHHTVTDNQFAAIVSLAFNVGIHNFSRSTLLKHVNAGNITAAADQFLVWNRAGGQVLNGLTRRRKAERALFLDKPILERAAGDIQQREEDRPEPDSSSAPLPPAEETPAPTQQAAPGAQATQVNLGAAVQPLPVVDRNEPPILASQGGLKSLWATVSGALAAIPTAIYGLIQGNAEVLKWGLIVAGVVVALYLMRQTILDVIRMWAAAHQDKNQVK